MAIHSAYSVSYPSPLPPDQDCARVFEVELRWRGGKARRIAVVYVQCNVYLQGLTANIRALLTFAAFDLKSLLHALLVGFTAQEFA